MKNPLFKHLLLVGFLALPLLATAQIEVHTNGQVTMGGRTPLRTPYDEGYINGSSNGACLYLEHNNFTPWSYGITTNVYNNMCTSYNLSYSGGAGVFFVSAQGWIYCNGTYYTSDSSLKTNITRLRNPMGLLNKISGYTYNYKRTVLDSGPEKGKLFYPDSSLHAGVMAQEVQKVAPYMVKTVKNGKLAVDYLQLVPLLLEGLKQEDSQRVALANQYNLLQSRFNALAQNLDTSGGNYRLTSTNGSNNTSADFVLYQNSPNPFSVQTTIGYALKGSYSAAYIYIFDLQGVLKKTFQLDGSGSVAVKSGDLYPGMFLYSLVVDGKQIDTKRMILTN